jgi:hypothetical protein
LPIILEAVTLLNNTGLLLKESNNLERVGNLLNNTSLLLKESNLETLATVVYDK